MKDLGRPADQNFKKGLGTRLQNGGPRGPTGRTWLVDMNGTVSQDISWGHTSTTDLKQCNQKIFDSLRWTHQVNETSDNRIST